MTFNDLFRRMIVFSSKSRRSPSTDRSCTYSPLIDFDMLDVGVYTYLINDNMGYVVKLVT